MALIDLKFLSQVLRMETAVNVILPDQLPPGTDTCKTLFLLHGLSQNYSSWQRRSAIERYAAERGIAVVMPSAGRSWYADMAYGPKYFTFVTEELPRVCRQHFRCLSTRREDTLVAGLSMGGYGAVKLALRCPETFGGCASLSGALDIVNRAKDPTSTIHGEWPCVFGNIPYDALTGTDCDLFHLAENYPRDRWPRLYIWCGTEDFLLEGNRRFHAHLEQLELAHHYAESDGDHAWKWWDKYIQDALDYLLQS